MHQTTVLKYTFKWIASFSSKQTNKKKTWNIIYDIHNLLHVSISRYPSSYNKQSDWNSFASLATQSLYLQDWPYSASAVRFVLKNVVII